MTLDQELQLKLNNVEKVFDLNTVASLHLDKDSVKNYYRINRIPYSIFHSRTGLIHMGISPGAIFKEADLLSQAHIIQTHIKRIGAKTVLELATGRGANSYYLAQNFPNTRFDGIDISEAQLAFAKKKSKKVNNYFPASGDYHEDRWRT